MEFGLAERAFSRALVRLEEGFALPGRSAAPGTGVLEHCGGLAGDHDLRLGEHAVPVVNRQRPGLKTATSTTSDLPRSEVVYGKGSPSAGLGAVAG